MLVNTGDGKGKSTAAFGVVLRALACDWQVCVLQFIKSGKWKVGEEKVARRLGVDWRAGGDGFSWLSPDLDESQRRALDCWRQARAVIAAGEHRLVVLDELTYPVNWGWIPVEEVVEALRGRPDRVNIVVTGRNAPAAIVEIADTVTEMVNVKHAYERGVRARRGIDF